MTYRNLFVLINDGTAHFNVTKPLGIHQFLAESPAEDFASVTLLDANGDGAQDIALFTDGRK